MEALSDIGGSGSEYNTCCCKPSCGTGCNTCETSCSAGGCASGASQDVIWSKTYTVSGANNIRLHFERFDVAGGTSRTGKDYVNLKRENDSVIAQLTGYVGANWTGWAGEGQDSMKVEFVADNVQDSTRGFVIDKLEYTTDTNGRFVLDLRMPGQVWDADAYASSNFRRWYRSEDGRYLSPDPIGLSGGEAGYFGYVGGNPIGATDPSGECPYCGARGWFRTNVGTIAFSESERCGRDGPPPPPVHPPPPPPPPPPPGPCQKAPDRRIQKYTMVQGGCANPDGAAEIASKCLRNPGRVFVYRPPAPGVPIVYTYDHVECNSGGNAFGFCVYTGCYDTGAPVPPYQNHGTDTLIP